MVDLNSFKSGFTASISLESKKIDANEETNTGFVKLFNGNLDGWKMIGNGSFTIIFENKDDEHKHRHSIRQGRPRI